MMPKLIQKTVQATCFFESDKHMGLVLSMNRKVYYGKLKMHPKMDAFTL
jgi:hypothetical protein